MPTTLLAAPALHAHNGPLAGKRYEVGSALRIGRHPFNEISIADPHASRYHCWVTIHQTGCILEDLASSNGTYVNNERVNTRRMLKSGDLIRVGSTEFLFAEPE